MLGAWRSASQSLTVTSPELDWTSKRLVRYSRSCSTFRSLTTTRPGPAARPTTASDRGCHRPGDPGQGGISKPLLLIVEDLHWADASTIKVLRQLLERLGSTSVSSISLLVRARPESANPT